MGELDLMCYSELLAWREVIIESRQLLRPSIIARTRLVYFNCDAILLRTISICLVGLLLNKSKKKKTNVWKINCIKSKKFVDSINIEL